VVETKISLVIAVFVFLRYHNDLYHNKVLTNLWRGYDQLLRTFVMWFVEIMRLICVRAC